MARRSLTISEEFGVWHVHVEGREVTDGTLVNALAKAAVTAQWRTTMGDNLGGTKLAFTAGVLEALLPPKREDTHGPVAA